jgi:hypothetical protein
MAIAHGKFLKEVPLKGKWRKRYKEPMLGLVRRGRKGR